MHHHRCVAICSRFGAPTKPSSSSSRMRRTAGRFGGPRQSPRPGRAGLSTLNAVPFTTVSPASGAWAPDRIFRSVDLPALFLPTRPCISPRAAPKPTLSRARPRQRRGGFVRPPGATFFQRQLEMLERLPNRRQPDDHVVRLGKPLAMLGQRRVRHLGHTVLKRSVERHQLACRAGFLPAWRRRAGTGQSLPRFDEIRNADPKPLRRPTRRQCPSRQNAVPQVL